MMPTSTWIKRFNHAANRISLSTPLTQEGTAYPSPYSNSSNSSTPGGEGFKFGSTVFFKSSNLTTLDRPNDRRTLQFVALIRAIRQMAELPASHSLHIDKVTADKSEALVGMLAHNFTIDAPRLFPQEGEALVLTWEAGDIKRLLTIAGEELDILDLNRKSRMRCSHDYLFSSDELPQWLTQVGGMQSASSVSEENAQ